MARHNIVIDSTGSAQPETLNCKPGDKITWTNNYTAALEGFTLPTCVAPQQSPAPVAPGATTQDYTVNQGSKGNFEYVYSWPSLKRDTRSGTIDVS